MHTLSELPIGGYTYSRYAVLAIARVVSVMIASDLLWYQVVAGVSVSGLMHSSIMSTSSTSSMLV